MLDISRVEIGDKVKINFDEVTDSIRDEVSLRHLVDFDEFYNGIHEVTKVFRDMLDDNKTKYVYLEDQYFFLANELIAVEDEKNI